MDILIQGVEEVDNCLLSTLITDRSLQRPALALPISLLCKGKTTKTTSVKFLRPTASTKSVSCLHAKDSASFVDVSIGGLELYIFHLPGQDGLSLKYPAIQRSFRSR